MDGMDALDQAAPDASQAPPQALAKPAGPTAGPAPAPHSKLSAYIQNLALGVDAFATSAATGGREGGVQEVQAVRNKQAELALQKQKAQQDLAESAVRIKHTQAMTNMATAQLNVLQHDAPLDYQKKVMDNQKSMVDLYSSLGVPSAFIVPMLEGQDTDTHMAAINGKAGGDLVNNTAIPVHDEKFAGNGTTTGYSFGELMNKQVTSDKAAPALMSLQNAINQASVYLPKNDPALQVAQGKLDQFKQGQTFSAADLLHFNQQTIAPLSAAVGRVKETQEFQTKQADLKEKQQKSDPLFKLENDPNEMAGEKSAAAVPMLQNKITAPGTSPEDKVRASRLLAQAKSAHQAYLSDITQKANAEQAAKQGDPKAAGAMLASGDLTLSDMKTRGMTPKFILETTQAAKAIDPKYNPADEMIAENVAKSPAQVQFFGSANSLISKNGTLDQVVDAGSKLPNHMMPIFNKVSDAMNYASGHKEVAAYLQTALGAADDYAKVLGGGQGTEGMQMHILNAMNASLNQGTREAVVGNMKKAVVSQVESRIGNNKFLMRQYGYALPQNQKPEVGGFDPSKDFKPISK